MIPRDSIERLAQILSRLESRVSHLEALEYALTKDAVLRSMLSNAGDLVSGPGPLTLPIGSGVLTADPTQAAGMIWRDTQWDRDNFLINGNFSVNQRLAAALTNIPGASATARIYTADRWGFTTGNITTPQYQWVDTITTPEANLNARYYVRYKQLTNAAKIAVSQVLEGTQTASLWNKTVRLTVKLRYSIGAVTTSIRIGLLQHTGTVDVMPASFVPSFNGPNVDPTWGTNLTALTPVANTGGEIVGDGVRCDLTTDWQQFSATFDVPIGCKNLVVALWSGAALAANDDILIAEVSLTSGSDFRDWSQRPQQYELALCQRYFAKTFSPGTPPAQNAGRISSIESGLTLAGVAASVGPVWPLPVTMRVGPNITFYNPQAANAFVRNASKANNATATSVMGGWTQSDSYVLIQQTGIAGWAVGDTLSIHMSADAEI